LPVVQTAVLKGREICATVDCSPFGSPKCRQLGPLSRLCPREKLGLRNLLGSILVHLRRYADAPLPQDLLPKERAESLAKWGKGARRLPAQGSPLVRPF